MALNVIASILEGVLGENGVNNVQDITSKFKDAMTDCGIRIDEWRDAYYRERIPKPMNNTSMMTQLKNLEIEVLQLRNSAWRDGGDRRARTLAGFDISSKNGHTILVPKTRNAQLMLANSVFDIKLRNNQSDIIDDLIKKNDELVKKMEEMQMRNYTETESNTSMFEQLKEAKNKAAELTALLERCESENLKLAKQIKFNEENAEDRIELINAHHMKEVSLLRKEIERMAIHTAQLADYNDLLEAQHDRNMRIIRGLAKKVNLDVEESDDDLQTDTPV